MLKLIYPVLTNDFNYLIVVLMDVQVFSHNNLQETNESQRVEWQATCMVWENG